jgi:protein TonB
VETGGQAAISAYFARVQAHLSRQAYPPESRAHGRGVVRVVFSLGRDGRVLSASVAEGSGQSALDQVALTIVRRAAPFPPFPSEIRESRLELGAPVRFDLR